MRRMSKKFRKNPEMTEDKYEGVFLAAGKGFA
jgi:hypothetical protein